MTTTAQRPVYEEQDDRAHDRCQDARALAFPIPAGGASQERGDERSGDTEQNGHQNVAAVTSGHDQLGERADDQTDDDGPKNVHDCLLSLPQMRSRAREPWAPARDLTSPAPAVLLEQTPDHTRS